MYMMYAMHCLLDPCYVVYGWDGLGIPGQWYSGYTKCVRSSSLWLKSHISWKEKGPALWQSCIALLFVLYCLVVYDGAINKTTAHNRSAHHTQP